VPKYDSNAACVELRVAHVLLDFQGFCDASTFNFDGNKGNLSKRIKECDQRAESNQALSSQLRAVLELFKVGGANKDWKPSSAESFLHRRIDVGNTFSL
jgi:hypothetical protein